MTRAFLIFWALLGTASGCESAPTRTVFIDVHTDLRPGVEFTSVETRILHGAGRGFQEQAALGGESRAWFEGQRVGSFDGVPAGLVTLQIALRSASGTVVLDRRVEVVVESSDVGLQVPLVRGCCGVTCPGPDDGSRATTCHRGRCVDPRCSSLDPLSCPLNTVPGLCPGAADACNRAEAPPGVDACLVVTDDSRCDSGLTCHPDLGCVPPVMQTIGLCVAAVEPITAMDAGVSDAGDTGLADAGDGGDSGDAAGGACPPRAATLTPACGPSDRPCLEACSFLDSACREACMVGPDCQACLSAVAIVCGQEEGCAEEVNCYFACEESACGGMFCDACMEEAGAFLSCLGGLDCTAYSAMCDL